MNHKERAVLSAIEVPSEAMIKAALPLAVTLFAGGKTTVGRVEIGGIITIWKTMHAAMMAEREPKIYKTTIAGIGPWCVEFDDGEIITTRTEERAKLIAGVK